MNRELHACAVVGTPSCSGVYVQQTYLIAAPILKIGKYMATIRPPTKMPNTAMMKGSRVP